MIMIIITFGNCTLPRPWIEWTGHIPRLVTVDESTSRGPIPPLVVHHDIPAYIMITGTLAVHNISPHPEREKAKRGNALYVIKKKVGLTETVHYFPFLERLAVWKRPHCQGCDGS